MKLFRFSPHLKCRKIKYGSLHLPYIRGVQTVLFGKIIFIPMSVFALRSYTYSINDTNIAFCVYSVIGSTKVRDRSVTIVSVG